MKTRLASWFDSTTKPRDGAQASVRVVLLVLVAFSLGAALTASWLYHLRPRSGNASHPEEATQSRLSESTSAVLNRLDSPVEVRFYSLLEPAGTPDSTKAFAQRVDQLLAQYAQEANGKLKLTRYNSISQANDNAALADGLKAIELNNGDVGYLGMALSAKGLKESVPQFSPLFEAALEPDITRAIARLLDATRSAAVAGGVSQVNTAAVQEVRALIPNLQAVSLDDGTRLLRESALKEFQASAQELEARVKGAQQQLAQAQNGKSEAEQQAAMQHLQQVQAEQNEKLKDIAAKAQAQIQALQQLKAKL